MVIIIDSSQEAIVTSMTRTGNPAAGTTISTGVWRYRILTDHISRAVKVNLDSIYS